MLRALVLAAVIAFLPASPMARALPGQATSVLHIKVVLIDGTGKVTPVPRHGLLISDNPASAPPRLIVTATDGTADVKLRPGNYTVESDKPVAFNGKAYQWTQNVDVTVGRDAVLELTAGNAEIASPGSARPGAPETSLEADPAFLLPQWQDSVVALWTPTLPGSGFVVDARGLVATNQRTIGNATSVEVQFSPAVKVSANVLAADPDRDVAILWIDPAAIASVKPVPLGCGQAARPEVVSGQELFTISTPFRQQTTMSSGIVKRLTAQELDADFILPMGGTGGPVFTGGGGVVGLTSGTSGKDQRSVADVRVVRADAACAVIGTAETKMKNATPPSAAHLPVEPDRQFPKKELEELAKKRLGSLNAYKVESANFDVGFITPVMTYGVQYQMEHGRPRTTSKDTRKPEPEPTLVRPLVDFSNWSSYVNDFPPVLMIRVTPRMVESFWTTVGRAAARTQGVSLPPIKRMKSGFSRMRAFCGETEVTPIHPFKLETRISESEAIFEGLYVYDSSALTPECGTVKLVLYSEKEPDKADTKVVDAAVIQQIWQDFAAYREAAR